MYAGARLYRQRRHREQHTVNTTALPGQDNNQIANQYTAQDDKDNSSVGLYYLLVQSSTVNLASVLLSLIDAARKFDIAALHYMYTAKYSMPLSAKHPTNSM